MLSELLSELAGRLRPLTTRIAPNVEAVSEDARLVYVDDRGPARLHTLTGVPSFLAFARRHGTADGSGVYVAPDGVRIVLDEVKGADHSEVRMALDHSTALLAWSAKVGKSLSPVQLRAFLDDRAEDLASKSVLAAVSGFKARVEIEFEADLETDAETVFRVKEGTRGSKAELPKDFGVKVPLWLGHSEVYVISVGLETVLSKEGPPSFVLRFRDLPDVLDLALCDLHARLNTELPGWMIVRGVPKSKSAVAAALLNGVGR